MSRIQEIFRSWLRPRILVPLVFLGVYTGYLGYYISPYAAGADSSGYMHEGRIFSEGRLTTPKREFSGVPSAELPHWTYIPLSFEAFDRPPDSLAPSYPPGLPLMIAAGLRIAGSDAGVWFVLVPHLFLIPWCVHQLGRRAGLPHGWAVAGAAIVSLSPLTMMFAIQPMTDSISIVWTTLAVLAALRSRELGARWAAASGFCVAIAVLIRPSNGLIFLPVLLALGAEPRRLASFAAGGLPGAWVLLALNAHYYGHPLKTGYGAIGSEFALAYAVDAGSLCVRWMPVLFTPIILAFPFLYIQANGRNRTGLILGVWTAAYLLFFLFYYHMRDAWWYLRFILPAAPPLVIGSLLAVAPLIDRGLDRLRPRLRQGVMVAAATLFFCAVRAGADHFYVFRTELGERTYHMIAQWVLRNLPEESGLVVMQASGAIFYYTPNPIIRYDGVHADGWERITAAASAEAQLHAILLPFEVDEGWPHHLAGNWEKIDSVRDVTIWRWFP